MSVASHSVSEVRAREFHYDQDLVHFPVLANDEVHVWHQDLNGGSSAIETFHGVLSSEEQQRALRFRFDRDRNESIVTRGTLRILLASYLRLAPMQLSFAYSEYGRPRLTPEAQANTIDFNVSHSGGQALLAFARGRTIGIDIERVRRDFATGEIAERFFSMAERDALRELPPGQRHEAFFRCWTRKEAFIKALGEGLSHPLDQFDVSLAPGAPAVLLATRPDAQEATRWKLCDIDVPGDYAAALATKVVGSTE
jgi:4'-phosphopantetheinyl transferase